MSFTYPGSDLAALSRISLRIGAGERIALVGPTGAGKTTLAKLLMGLYRPTSGRILVDGVELTERDPAAWRRRLGAVFHTVNRYQTTVRENIGFGRPDRIGDTAAIQVAAARSGADEVIENLPQGRETPLGKEFHDGEELSVGQWQRLAIARAYLRESELLILDEPASALDAKTEAEVYSHFAQMAEAGTVILISHRLGSCRLADRILVLQDGRLTEEGSHEALLAADGEYAALYRMQAAWYEER